MTRWLGVSILIVSALLAALLIGRYAKQLSVPPHLVKSQLSFIFGDILATIRAPAIQGCEFAPRSLQAFCYEGYGRHLFTSTEAPLRERVFAFTATFPLGPAISGFNSLGTGFYFIRMPPPEIVELLKRTLGSNDIRVDYAINGWGFAKTRAEKLPPQTALTICDDFVDEGHRDNCLFGAGRASYFIGNTASGIVESPETQREPWFLRGYGFAATFAGHEELSHWSALPETTRNRLSEGAKLALARRLIYTETDNRPADGPVADPATANIDADVLRIASCLRLYKQSLRCLEP